MRSHSLVSCCLTLFLSLALACQPPPAPPAAGSVVEPTDTPVVGAASGPSELAGADGDVTRVAPVEAHSTPAQAEPTSTLVPTTTLVEEPVGEGVAPVAPVPIQAEAPTPPPSEEPALPGASVERPSFSDVAQRTPVEVVAYLAGRLPDYPGSSPAALFDFSASNILETMDTAILDWIERHRGTAALQRVYDLIARAILATLRDQYGDQWILVPLDAGHGGKKGFVWDGGSGGTEADHNRAVVAALSRLAQEPAYERIILRPIHNDALADDFGLPPSLNKPPINRTLMRQARASMLAAEAAAWNGAQRDPTSHVSVHEISIHFNAGAGGALVLHQGNSVRPEFARRSIEFGGRYLSRVTADLNASGLLPAPLRLWNGTGLHDDVMMYRPSYFRDDEIRGITLRYAALQGAGYLPRYIQTVLAHWSGR